MISGTFAIVNVLSDMIGPGTIGIFGNSQDFFIATGKQIRSMRTHYFPLFLSKVKKYIHSKYYL